LLVLLWAVACIGLTLAAPAAARSPAPWRAACLAGAIVIISLVLAYGVRGAPIPIRAAILVVATVAVVAALGWSLLVARKREPEAPSKSSVQLALLVAIMCVGYALGLAFLGNIGVQGVAKLVGGLWPWGDVPIVNRTLPSAVAPAKGIAQSLLCETGYEWTARTLAGHCSSVARLSRSYGLAPLLMIVFAAWRLWGWRATSENGDSVPTMAFWGFVLCLIAFPGSFLLYDFIGGSHGDPDSNLSVWLKSRLLEPWFYSGAMLAVALYLPRASRRGRKFAQSAMLAAVAVATLSPFWVPAQMTVNAAYLVEHAVGLSPDD
jgi:hypothetical protein